MSCGNKLKFVIMPGSGSSVDVLKANWYGWMLRKLQDAGFEVRLQNMPDPIVARESIWLPVMEKELECDENTIIIGHSAGAQAAMRYAESHKVRGIVVISASVTDLGRPQDTISEYYNRPWLWGKIKGNVKAIVQFGSRDDPIIPFYEQEEVAKGLGAKFLDYHDRGHFNRSPFPELLKQALDMAKETSDDACTT